MTFAVRTAKADRQGQLKALHTAHAHVETYVPAEDDSDAPRYSGHWFVTNQEGWESGPTVQRFTCASEAVANQVAAALNDAVTAGGCWSRKEKQPDKRVKDVYSALPTSTWVPWLPGNHAPTVLAAYVSGLIGKGWHAHVEALKPKGPAPKAA